jgi:hypothetical protein
MPRWWTLEQVAYMKKLLSYIVGEDGYASILERFATVKALDNYGEPSTWMQEG